MKRYCLAIVGLLVLAGCSATKEAEKIHATQETMELGWIQREDFMRPEYPKFKENYDTCRVDENFIEMIGSLHAGIDFVVFLGTWCSDSRREVSRFLKIADLASIPPSQITFYGVDRTKKSADGVTDRYKLELVSTIVLLKRGEEVGRIVELPKNSMEEHLLILLAEAQHK